jgi:hypothetical protein
MTARPKTLETDPVEAERARHTALLRELQELGMRAARAAAVRAEAAEGEGECGAAVLALGRAGKLVRQCIALERDLRRTMEQDAQAARDAAPDAAAVAAAKEADEGTKRRYWRMLWGRFGRGLVRDSIARLIDAEDRPAGERERLLSDLKDRLDARDQTVGDHFSVAQDVERLAEAMGLDIDWRLFDGHGWAAEYEGVLAGRRLKLAAQAARARPPP